MKKKIFCILTTALISLCAASAVYAQGSAAIYPTKSAYSFNGSTDIGKTFEVEYNLDLNDNAQIDQTTFYIQYDPSVIVFKRALEPDISKAVTYPISDTNTSYFVSPGTLDSAGSIVNPKNGIPMIEKIPDGVSSTAELGEMKIIALTGAYGGGGGLYQIGDGGILFSAEFEVTGSGETEINIFSYGATLSSSKTGPVNPVDITNCTVKVSGTPSTPKPSAPAESTTEAATGSQSSSGSSGGGGGASGSSVTETASESTTEGITSDNEAPKADTSEPETVADPTVQEYAFSDLSETPWAAEAVNYLASKGILNGYNDGSFLPKNNVTRADFIIMLINTLGIETGADDSFVDVRPDKYYAKYISAAKAAGIAKGYEDGTFAPEDFITRQDMMVLAERAVAAVKPGILPTADTEKLTAFSDSDQISSYAADSIAVMAQAGIVQGSDGAISPKAYSTRAQTAVIMYNIIKTAEQ